MNGSIMEKGKEFRRKLILDAAVALVRAGGAGAVSLEDIAKSAGLTRRTLYNHFPSKDSLLCAMGKPVRERISERIRGFEPVKGCDPVTSVASFLCELWRDFGDEIDLFTDRSLAALPELGIEYETLKNDFFALFESRPLKGRLRLDSMTSALLAYRTLPAVGRTLEGRPRGTQDFIATLRGLLSKDL